MASTCELSALGVRAADDRDANLETAYLLQRLESFDGVVMVTKNPRKHIQDYGISARSLAQRFINPVNSGIAGGGNPDRTGDLLHAMQATSPVESDASRR
jgi:hypothetical protein